MKHLTIGMTLFLLIASVQAGTWWENFDDNSFLKMVEVVATQPPVADWSVKDGELKGGFHDSGKI